MKQHNFPPWLDLLIPHILVIVISPGYNCILVLVAVISIVEATF